MLGLQYPIFIQLLYRENVTFEFNNRSEYSIILPAQTVSKKFIKRMTFYRDILRMNYSIK